MPSKQVVYSSIVSFYDSLPKLEGRTVRALHSEYSFAALRLDNEEVVAFSVEEELVGKWFEVFPIRLHSVALAYPLAWTELDVPFTVAHSKMMWREEWLEPAKDSSGLVGSGPHYEQCVSTLGSAPKAATNVVKVLAGVRLTGWDERSLVICSSDNTPFKVDLTMDRSEIHEMMRFHTCE
jgi:hypothetical protein